MCASEQICAAADVLSTLAPMRRSQRRGAEVLAQRQILSICFIATHGSGMPVLSFLTRASQPHETTNFMFCGTKGSPKRFRRRRERGVRAARWNWHRRRQRWRQHRPPAPTLSSHIQLLTPQVTSIHQIHWFANDARIAC